MRRMSRVRRKEYYKSMIKLENVVLANTGQMEFIIEGMRNPMNSWDKSDSYAWHEYMGSGDERFRLGVSNSCSTMHKIAEKKFTLEDFSCEHLMDFEEKGKLSFSPLGTLQNTIDELNDCRDLYLKTKNKAYWWQMIQLLPSSYNQTRNVFLNYEVLANIYKSRKNHKLDEWVEFCKWIESLPYSELITGENDE